MCSLTLFNIQARFHLTYYRHDHNYNERIFFSNFPLQLHVKNEDAVDSLSPTSNGGMHYEMPDVAMGTASAVSNGLGSKAGSKTSATARRESPNSSKVGS